MARPESLHTYRFADLPVHSTRALPELYDDADGTAGPPLHLSWQSGLTVPDASWFHQWGDNPTWARFGATGTGYVVEFPGLAVFTLDEAATCMEIAVAPDVPDFTARHLLLNQVLPLVLSHRGRTVMHAGAVAINGEVTAFVGTTGSGKSTLVAACAAAGAEVMADDSLVVRPPVRGASGRWIAVPAYPSVRLWSDSLRRLQMPEVPDLVAHYTDKYRLGTDTSSWTFGSEPRPLTRVVLLEAPDEVRRPVALALFSQMFRLDVRDSLGAVRLFHTVADLARDVSVVRFADATDDRIPHESARLLMSGSMLATPALVRA